MYRHGCFLNIWVPQNHGFQYSIRRLTLDDREVPPILGSKQIIVLNLVGFPSINHPFWDPPVTQTSILPSGNLT